MIAALGGVEPLPSFPHPTVCPPESEFRTRANNLSRMAKVGLTVSPLLCRRRRSQSCVVDVDENRKGSLPPPTLLWDALEDLPQVSCFDMTESMAYG